MSRFQSSFRMFSARILSVACGLVISAFMAPGFSQVPVSNNAFSITFPGGWTKVPLGTTDTSSATLFNLASGASAFLFAAAHVGNLTAAEIAAALEGFGATDSLEVTADGTKTLGGKSFSFIEWKKSAATGDEAKDRFRVYFLTTGTFMFEGILGFDTDNAESAIGDMETALATLNLTGGTTGLRAVSAALRPTPFRADRDVLGRQARLPSPGKRLPVALFKGK